MASDQIAALETELKEANRRTDRAEGTLSHVLEIVAAKSAQQAVPDEVQRLQRDLDNRTELICFLAEDLVRRGKENARLQVEIAQLQGENARLKQQTQPLYRQNDQYTTNETYVDHHLATQAQDNARLTKTADALQKHMQLDINLPHLLAQVQENARLEQTIEALQKQTQVNIDMQQTASGSSSKGKEPVRNQDAQMGSINQVGVPQGIHINNALQLRHESGPTQDTVYLPDGSVMNVNHGGPPAKHADFVPARPAYRPRTRPVSDQEHRRLSGMATYIESKDIYELEQFWNEESRRTPGYSPRALAAYYEANILPRYLARFGEIVEEDVIAGSSKDAQHGEEDLLGEGTTYEQPKQPHILDADEIFGNSFTTQQSQEDHTPAASDNDSAGAGQTGPALSAGQNNTNPNEDDLSRMKASRFADGADVHKDSRLPRYTGKRAGKARYFWYMNPELPDYPRHRSNWRDKNAVMLSGLPENVSLTDVLPHIAGGALLSIKFGQTSGMKTNPPTNGNSAIVVFRETSSAEDYTEYRHTHPLYLEDPQSKKQTLITVQHVHTNTSPIYFDRLTYPGMHDIPLSERFRNMSRRLFVEYASDCHEKYIKTARQLVRIVLWACKTDPVEHPLRFWNEGNVAFIEFSSIREALSAKTDLLEREIITAKGIWHGFNVDECERGFEELPVTTA